MYGRKGEWKKFLRNLALNGNVIQVSQNGTCIFVVSIFSPFFNPESYADGIPLHMTYPKFNSLQLTTSFIMEIYPFDSSGMATSSEVSLIF